MTPDGRPIPWPEGEDVGTYEDSQSMVHSKIGSKKTYVPTQFSFEPACKSDPLSSLVNYIVVAAGILEASDNTHTHIPNNPPCDCWSRRESATFCLTAWGPKQKWFWTRSFAAESKWIGECGGPCCSTLFLICFFVWHIQAQMLHRDAVGCCSLQLVSHGQSGFHMDWMDWYRSD